MPQLTLWKAGNSIVMTITKRLARQFSLAAGSVVTIDPGKTPAAGFRVIPPPVRLVSRPPVPGRPRRTRPRA